MKLYKSRASLSFLVQEVLFFVYSKRDMAKTFDGLSNPYESIYR